MTTETLLTDDHIRSLTEEDVVCFGRNIEQAVMQSPEVQAWKRDAERVEFIETLYGADIVCFDSGNWEVSSSDIYFGEGRSLRSAIDAAKDQT